jgi:hypothetical protein
MLAAFAFCLGSLPGSRAGQHSLGVVVGGFFWPSVASWSRLVVFGAKASAFLHSWRSSALRFIILRFITTTLPGYLGISWKRPPDVSKRSTAKREESGWSSLGPAYRLGVFGVCLPSRLGVLVCGVLHGRKDSNEPFNDTHRRFLLFPGPSLDEPFPLHGSWAAVCLNWMLHCEVIS